MAGPTGRGGGGPVGSRTAGWPGCRRTEMPDSEPASLNSRSITAAAGPWPGFATGGFGLPLAAVIMRETARLPA